MGRTEHECEGLKAAERSEILAGVEIFIDDNDKWVLWLPIWADGGVTGMPSGRVFIQYCPFCGASLEPYKRQNKCRDCKHWGVESATGYHWYDASPGRECGSPKFIYMEIFGGRAALPVDALGYEDGEGCQAGLCTGADFGCIHWEGE